MSRRAALLVLAAPVLVAGCLDVIDGLDPMVGNPINERCANEDSDPRQDVSFSQQVLPILKGAAGPVGCSCHQPTDPNPIGLEQVGLNLSSYASLRAGGVNSRATIVVPAQPCSSVLWQKISAGPPFGSRMPFSGPPFLEPAQRQLIADWIAEGALDD